MAGVAVVTGGGRGIGAAVCELLGGPEHRYAVVVNYHNDEAAAEQVAAAVCAGGGTARAVRADVADEAEVARLFGVADSMGTLTALVNNAGVYGPRMRLEDLSAADMWRVLGTNVVGAMLCSQQAVRRMSTRHGGSGGGIVNVSSGSAYIGNPEGVLYSVSKGAMNSLSAGLVAALTAEGVRVNTVLPGATRTQMIEGREEAMAKEIPAGRAADPAEIANVVAFLLSQKASFCAGASVRVAGGRP